MVSDEWSEDVALVQEMGGTVLSTVPLSSAEISEKTQIVQTTVSSDDVDWLDRRENACCHRSHQAIPRLHHFTSCLYYFIEEEILIHQFVCSLLTIKGQVSLSYTKLDKSLILLLPFSHIKILRMRL